MDAVSPDARRMESTQNAQESGLQSIKKLKVRQYALRDEKPSQGQPGRKTWTPEIVADRLQSAASTIRDLHVPGVRPPGVGNKWPDVVHEANQAYGWNKAKSKTPLPTTEQITAMDEALAWLTLLQPEEAKLAWMKANREQWKAIAREVGKCRTTLWNRWSSSLVQIAAHLNAVEGERSI